MNHHRPRTIKRPRLSTRITNRRRTMQIQMIYNTKPVSHYAPTFQHLFFLLAY